MSLLGKSSKVPEHIELSVGKTNSLRERIERSNTLSSSDKSILEGLLSLNVLVYDLLERNNMTLFRLRKALGIESSTEKEKK